MLHGPTSDLFNLNTLDVSDIRYPLLYNVSYLEIIPNMESDESINLNLYSLAIGVLTCDFLCGTDCEIIGQRPLRQAADSSMGDRLKSLIDKCFDFNYTYSISWEGSDFTVEIGLQQFYCYCQTRDCMALCFASSCYMCTHTCMLID